MFLSVTSEFRTLILYSVVSILDGCILFVKNIMNYFFLVYYLEPYQRM